MTELVVGPGEAGARVDAFLAARLHASRAAIRRLLERGAVRVGGRRAKKGQRLLAGERVALSESLPGPAELLPQPEPDAPLDLVYEDADLVAMAKPAGPPSHPLRPGERGTVAGALAARHPECAQAGADPREGGLVHRLDAGTSGVLVAARSPAAWRALRAAFAGHRVKKEYLALVQGQPRTDAGSIDAPLVSRGRKTVVDPAGRPARTDWTVLERLAGGWTLLRLTTETGHMHQVRAHLAHAELPIAGDALYGGPPLAGLRGHFLHAARLLLPHPTTARPLELSAPLPADRAALLESLRAGVA